MACFYRSGIRNNMSDTRPGCIMGTHIVLHGPVAKLAGKDIEYLPLAPSFLAVCVVCEMVWMNASQSVFKVVGAGPWIAWCGDYCWRGGSLSVLLKGFISCIYGGEGHCRQRDYALAYQMGENTRRGRQEEGC